MKKYLLDTHALIWAIAYDSKLSEPVLKILHDDDSLLFVSTVSLWEMAIKHGNGKMNWENLQIYEIPYYCELLRIDIIPLMPQDAINYSSLPFYGNHKDPFDRMLINQCISGNYT